MSEPNDKNSSLDELNTVLKKMGLSTLQAGQFLGIRQKLVNSKDGYIREASLTPIKSINSLSEANSQLHDVKCVSIKLNGGLGTSMGLRGPKSELKVKNGLSFLDICIKQAQTSASPLILMNSPQTDKTTRELLSQLPSNDTVDVTTFLQSSVPKLSRESLGIPQTHIDGMMENPPGHGEVFDRLFETGLASKLVGEGYEYAFISNIDNLGAHPANNIASYIKEKKIPFLMEVTKRQLSDNKGGHLALGDSGYILRETAQCHPDDKKDFENVEKHQFFNTNNIWVDLNYLVERYNKKRPFELSAIANYKTLNPRDKNSEKIVQLERAMGSAIEDIDGAEILLVERSRFCKVKNTADLLLVRSDLYQLNDLYHIVPSSEQMHLNPPKIKLNDEYYKHIDDFEKRIPENLPSFKELKSLVINSDQGLNESTSLVGDVSL